MLKRFLTQQSLCGKRWFWGVGLLFVFDQMSKWAILKSLSPGEAQSLLPGLQFLLSFNTGVAFSLFSHQGQWGQVLLIMLVTLVCLWLSSWLLATPRHHCYVGIALTLILGGALGNLFDRIVYGHVIDFIDFYIGHWHWYTFNFADVFISLGAFVMLLDVIKRR